MAYKYFSHNCEILPIEQAVVPLSSLEYSYGYGVYETLHISKGKLYFLEEHVARLMNSAKMIGLEHNFSEPAVSDSIKELVKRNKTDACNIKVLLIGGLNKETANLYIMCLNPLFVERKLYKSGVHCISVKYERLNPQAKTLNMLPSYLYYKDAKTKHAYDVLFVDNNDCVREGSRTNIMGLKGKVLISPPDDQILQGVMRSNVLKVAESDGFELKQQPIKYSDLAGFDSLFLTSTSSKILPINSIDEIKINTNNDNLSSLMRAFDDFLKQYSAA